jgi:hypothetical protein
MELTDGDQASARVAVTEDRRTVFSLSLYFSRLAIRPGIGRFRIHRDLPMERIFPERAYRW